MSIRDEAAVEQDKDKQDDGHDSRHETASGQHAERRVEARHAKWAHDTRYGRSGSQKSRPGPL